MSKSMVKRLASQLADEPREKLIEIIARLQAEIETLCAQVIRPIGQPRHK